MLNPYLLPREHHAIPLTSLRCYAHARHPWAALKPRDAAASIMVDFERDPVLTVTEETDLDVALDGMFRLGVRVFLVVRASAVVGMLSIEDARRPRSAGARACGGAAPARVADAMVPCAQLPAIDWQMLQQCRIEDLAEIFAGSGTPYLVVLEDETPQCSRVRGLIARDRLEGPVPPRADSD